MKIAEATHGLTKGTQVQINEGQYILLRHKAPSQLLLIQMIPLFKFTMPLADKKIDPTEPTT